MILNSTAQAPVNSATDWWAETTGDASSTAATEKPTAEASPAPAGLVTAMRSGTIEDPMTKIRLFAQKRFPTEPDEERIGRYGLLDGKVVYRDEDGKLRYELGPGGRVAAWLGENALPAVGSVAAAGAAVGTGGAAIPVMAALGGAGGMGYRKVLGALQGDQQTVGGNVKDMAIEGTVDAAGAKAGELAGKLIANRRTARDIANFSASNAQRLIDLAKARGVAITPAEATNLGSLIQQQSMLGQGADEAADVLRQFYGDRTENVIKAIDDFIGTTPGPHEVGKLATDASGDLIDAAKASRTAASKPLYEATVKREALLPKEALAPFADDPVMRKVFGKVRNEGLFVGDGVPDNSLLMIDGVKKELDDMISSLTFRTSSDAFPGNYRQRRQALGYFGVLSSIKCRV